jgi:hypothetical protein
MNEHETTTADRRRRRIHRVLALVVGLTVLAPVGAWASHQFNDVPNSNIFHADIDWLADNGVTLGCNPPANTRFCPKDEVTREQMAAFMHRLETRGVFLSGDTTMVPIARFRIAINGVVANAETRAPVTGAPSASWNGTSWVVDVPGEVVNLNDQQALCSGVGSIARIVTVGSSGGNLLVHTFSAAGASTQVAVMCTLYADA